jgi:branched-chain amino acid transport system permease protein
MAYFVARTFYYLNTQQSWPIWSAALLAIVVAGPVLGALLWAVLFRHITNTSTLVKVVATIGVSVALPPITQMIYGNQPIQTVPGLAPLPVKVFHIARVTITLDQVIVLASVLFLMLAGLLILRYTSAGLTVRALVDSEPMTRLVGTNPQAVEVAVWAFGGLLAGLAGVLMAPIIGLDPVVFTVLIAGALTAVVIGRLRNLGIAVAAALLLGVAGSVLQDYIPPSSSLSQDITPAIPFAFVLLFLLYSSLRGGARTSEERGGLTQLGNSFALADEAVDSRVRRSDDEARSRAPATEWAAHLGSRYGGVAVFMAIVAVLPLLLQSYWVALVGLGFAYGIALLSYTLITGEGGVISLCQITYAGMGSIVTAQLATVHGWPVLAAIVVGGLVTLPIGIVIGFLTLRLGDIYVALVTLTFGLLMDSVVFNQNQYYQFGLGVNVPRPSFAQSNLGYTYLTLIAFCIIAVLVVNLRRSTTGLAVSAVRWSEPGARTIGLSVVQMKLLVFALSAMVAGIAGGFLSMYTGSSQPQTFATFTGFVWLAVIVANGIRSNVAAVTGGLSLALFPAIVLAWFPRSLTELPTALFGLAALGVARDPGGFVPQVGRQIRQLTKRVAGSHRGVPDPPATGQPTSTRRAATLGAPGG